MSLFTEFDHYNLPIGPNGTPFEYFEALRDEAIANGTPLGWSEAHGGFWVVVGYDEAREIDTNPQIFSSLFPTVPAYGTPDDQPLMLAGMDNPQHDRYRKIVQAPFGPGGIGSMEPSLRAMTNDFIDRFIDQGRIDVVAAIGDEVPAGMTAIIMGLEAGMGPTYREWTHAMSQGIHDDPDRAAKLLADMDQHFDDMIRERRATPGTDVVSNVVQSEIDGERLNDREAKDFAIILLLGGIDNTEKLFGNMFWRLSWDKELRRRLTRYPDLIPTVVEEFLRFYSPSMSCRYTLEPYDLGGVHIEKGQHLVLCHNSINRDPRQFPNPDAFVPERAPNRHIGLGMGIHRCLGAHLVRLEARVVLEEFLKRIPVWEMDPEETTTFLHGQALGVDQVHIVFPPGGGVPSRDWTPARPVPA